MTNNFIFDATPENFNELVIGNSERGPVMVNYWAAHAGPCIKLWPTLEALANEFNGRFLLVNLNTDKYRSFAQNELGVRSVPTLQIFFRQQVVDVMHGAESEQSIRSLLSRHLPRASDTLLLESIKLYNNNQADQAIEELKQLQQSDPENPRIATSIIKLLFRENRFEELHRYVESQSAVVQNNEEVISLITHACLQQAAAEVEDSESLQSEPARETQNMDAIYRKVAINALNDNIIQALELLLEMLAIDPAYRNKLPAKTMVLLLNSLDKNAEEVRHYRNRMMDILSTHCE